MFSFIIGLFIGSFLFFNPAFIVPVLLAVNIYWFYKWILIYKKSGELDI